ncbi:hypothetical protein AB205_0081340 [Aquarana catesbeiana]|uniref:Uncharacterized protein n=1 Tax=Aquarana catesbeiana TaxID=8400 RepID=A0A2G9RWK8_AQUCT|nr:hypothetical protein AB205_0081340 [Aquarana catesbeiana]PIO32316.1 hypothetical protein AB205_0081340 [Aquarana catesbeiana]PIO32318.1 hypothetical protein AB205_0081340 [Aquarana catesbeiana]
MAAAWSLTTGLLVTLSSAANATCPSGPLNETVICTNITGDISVNNCSFQQYACSNSSVLAALPDNILANLSTCYTNDTIESLDPVYLSLFLSKLDMNKTNITFGSLNSQFSSFSPGWRKFLWNGIWPQLIQNLNNSVGPLQWIPSSLQPFLVQVTPDMVTCLQQQNVTCGIFQELVKNLDLAFPKMTDVGRQVLYPALKSFLANKQNVSGSACSQNTTSSVWIQQNLGMFSQFASLGDFTALNPNFIPMDALSFLTLQQIANFSVYSNLINNSAAVGNILAAVSNISSVLDFLSSLNAAAMAKNISSLQPPLAQALLNRTFEALRANISSFNVSDWTQLFQNTLSTVLPEITPDQLNLIPPNLTCGSYQAIIKGLDSKFSKMDPVKQQADFQTFVKPYLKKQGPACSQNLTSSELINLNLKSFSQFLDYSDFLALNANFTALDVLPLLNIRQRVNFTLGANLSADQAASVAGSLQNAGDVYDFLGQLNAAFNGSMLSQPLSQALLNQTFEVLKSNFSNWNSSDWSQLFQNKLSFVLPAITPGQLILINQSISCDSYQAIVAGLNSKFPQMTPGTQKNVFKNLIQPYVKNKGPACSKNGSSSVLLNQNFGKFSVFADYSELVSGLGDKFNASDVVPSLSPPQLANFALNTTMNAQIANSIVGALQNSADVYNFLSSFNAGLASVSDNKTCTGSHSCYAKTNT